MQEVREDGGEMGQASEEVREEEGAEVQMMCDKCGLVPGRGKSRRIAGAGMMVCGDCFQKILKGLNFTRKRPGSPSRKSCARCSMSMPINSSFCPQCKTNEFKRMEVAM
jgi:hypothetical protein